jgi:two-component system, cell cycle response regulator DivK
MKEEPRILVVEDDDSSREALTALLRADGYCVDDAADGVEALAMANAHEPAIVVTDICLPHMSGTELCRRLRASPQGRCATIFAITALSRDQWKSFDGAGFDAVFSKPLDYDALLTRVAERAHTH